MKVKDSGHPASNGLDREIQQFADTVKGDYERYAASASPTLAQARETAELVRHRWKQGGPSMARTTDFTVSVDNDSTVRVRLFEPDLESDRPALIYLHGGGWTLFSLETHDRLMREYAARAGMKVIGVDYSLAPENKFPHQVHEVMAVLLWIHGNGPKLGIAPGRLAIGGDSAGANMAVATCLMARDENLAPGIRGMLLNYGAYDASAAYAGDLPETDEHQTLTHQEMSGFWQNYLADPEDRLHPWVSPLQACLEGLPPALMVIAEHDILARENLALASRFRQAGVAAEAVVFPGTTHSFLEAVSIARVSDRALEQSSRWLARNV